MINWQTLLEWKKTNPENWERQISEIIWSYQNKMKGLLNSVLEARRKQNKKALEMALIGIQQAALQVGAESVQFRARVLAEAQLNRDDIDTYFRTLENSVTSSILQLKEFESNLHDH